MNSDKSTMKNFLWLFAILLVMIGLGGFAFYRNLQLNNIVDTNLEERLSQAQLDILGKNSPSAASGLNKVFFSSTSEENILPVQYYADLNTGGIDKANITSDDGEYFYNISKLNDKAAFVGVSKSVIQDMFERGEEIGKAFQLYVGNVTDTQLPVVADSQKITNTNIVSKISPKFSPSSNRVLYTVADDSILDKETIDPYSIRIVDLSTGKDEQLLDKATSPDWIDSDTFVYLSNKGLELYDLRDNSSVELLSFEGQINVKFDISESAKYIAVSVPDTSKVFVYEFEGKTLKSFSEIQTRAYWVVFSPQENEILVQTVLDEKSNSGPKLGFYDLSGNVSRKDIMLSGFRNDGLFINQWK